MRTSLFLALLLSGSGSALAQSAAEVSRTAREPVFVGYQVETAVASTYVFRGIPQYLSLSDPSSQTTALIHLDHVGPGSIIASVWNATALRNFSSQPGNAIEFDLSAAYSVRLAHRVDLTVGYTAFLYPKQTAGAPVDGVHEVGISAAYPNGFITPSIGVYAEVVRQLGAYVVLGGTHDFVRRWLTITPQADLGVAAYQQYLGTNHAAPLHLNDVTVALNAKASLPRSFYISLKASYSYRGTPAELMQPGTERNSAYAMLAVGAAR